MKAGEAIALLSKYYAPEDEIFVAWWDKEWADNYFFYEVKNGEVPVSKLAEVWQLAVQNLENEENAFGESVAYALSGAYKEVMDNV